MMMNVGHFVLTDKDLVHVISSFMKTEPCGMHEKCDVNERSVSNKRICKWHRDCVPVKYEKLKDGDSIVAAGWLGMLCLVESRLEFSPFVMDYAAENGHLEVIKWMHLNRTEGSSALAILKAAVNGHLEVLKWLHLNRRGEGEGELEGICRTEAMNLSAENGHLEVVKWLHTNRTEGCTTYAMDWGAANGHLEVVKWLHANRTEGCSKLAMDWAASDGYLEVVKWLHTNRSEGCREHAMTWAASNGHMEVVKWLHLNRSEVDLDRTKEWAIRNERLDVVKWLEEIRLN